MRVEQPGVALPHLVGPDLAAVVHAGVAGTGAAFGCGFAFGDVLERVGVLGHVGAVGHAADAGVEGIGHIARQAIGPLPAVVAGLQAVFWPHREHEAVDVAPALAHGPGLLVGGVGQTVVHVVEELMRDDLVVQRAVEINRGLALQGHLHLHAFCQQGFDGVTIGLADHHRGNGVGEVGIERHIRQRAGQRRHRYIDGQIGIAHADGLAAGVIHHDHCRCARELGKAGLGGEVAVATVEQNDLPLQRGTWRGGQMGGHQAKARRVRQRNHLAAAITEARRLKAIVG